MIKEYQIKTVNDFSYLSFPFLEQFDFLIHGFTLKNGKEKDGKKILKEKGLSSLPIFSLRQIHSDKVMVVPQGKDLAEKNLFGDAVLTNQPNLVLTVSVADCIPIFLVNPKDRIIGLVHAGWKGSLLNIVFQTLTKAFEKWGVQAEDFYVLLGPSIQSCCYEIGEEMAILFEDEWVNRSFQQKPRLNLAGLNVGQLLKGGVKKENIFQIKDCTSCQSKLFYSYRKEGKEAGRMIAFLTLL
jgi:YfiH family protein